MPPSQTDDPRGLPRDARRVKEMISFVEPHSVVLRRRAGVGPIERLDPWAVAPCFGLAFVRLDGIDEARDDDRSRVSGLTAKQWSGMGYPLPDGGILVMLNPNQTPERANVTIMVVGGSIRRRLKQQVPVGPWSPLDFSPQYNAIIRRGRGTGKSYWIRGIHTPAHAGAVRRSRLSGVV